MFREDNSDYDQPCSDDCGCAPGTCTVDGLIPAYVPNDFQRNVTVLNRALENLAFAAAVVARLTDEAYAELQEV